jgi:hypothetical protein
MPLDILKNSGLLAIKSLCDFFVVHTFLIQGIHFFPQTIKFCLLLRPSVLNFFDFLFVPVYFLLEVCICVDKLLSVLLASHVVVFKDLVK